MKELKIDYEKEYLLPHEILEALRWVGMNITKAGTREKGYVPINSLILSTCTMHYGTLTHFINTREVSKTNADLANSFSSRIMTDNEINQDLYSLAEVETALEFLQANHDIEMEVIGTGEDISSKVIRMTDAGLMSFANKTFLKVYLKEREAERAYLSTLGTNALALSTNNSISDTNFWMKIFTAILAFQALIQLIQIFRGK